VADAPAPRNAGEAADLATACWILVAAFSARRDKEVLEIEDGCLLGSDEDGWWVRFHIEKTLQRADAVPVPGIVASAIRRLMELSATARAATGEPSIFQWRDGDGVPVRLDPGRRLDHFAALVGTPTHVDRKGRSSAWHWHPHQFRRFFAILYFYRFEGATIEALSHHLRHFSLEMTRRYVTVDPEVAAMWTDVRWGYERRVAVEIVSGTATGGGAGDRLRRLAERIRDAIIRKLHVVHPDNLGSALALVMRRQGLVLTPKPWVTCTCPATREGARKAACRRETAGDAADAGPDFARAGPTVCGGCPHAMIADRHRAAVAAEVEHLSSATSGPRAGTLFGALEAARVAQLEHVAASRYARVAGLPAGSAE
jgi:hypothetical protein